MAQTVLVGTDRQIVAKLLEAVDKSTLDIRILLVAKFEDYYGARLVLASPAFDQHREIFNYKEVGALLRESGLYGEVPSLLLVKMDDPIVLALKTSFGTLDDVRGIPFGPQLLGDRFVEDGVLYRIR